MPTTTRPAPDVQELLAAYRMLDLPPQASAVAVRLRYRELAELHHAAERMRGIDAAYELVGDAPLQYREIPVEPASEPIDAPASRPHWLTRLDSGPSVFARFVLGMLAGSSLATLLGFRGPTPDPLYAWLAAVAMGIVFTGTSRISRLLLRTIVTALRRR